MLSDRLRDMLSPLFFPLVQPPFSNAVELSNSIIRLVLVAESDDQWRYAVRLFDPGDTRPLSNRKPCQQFSLYRWRYGHGHL